MAFLFGGAPEGLSASTPEKALLDSLKNAGRVIQRDYRKSLMTEKSVIQEIKSLARQNKHHLATLKAKELVRLRSFQEKLQVSQCHLSSLQHNVSTMSSSQVLQESFVKTGKLLKNLNSQMNAASVMKVLRDFQLQSENFSTKQELIQEAVDESAKIEGEEEVTDSTVAMVFQELGLEASRGLASARTQPTDSLEERFQTLKLKMEKLN